MDLSLLRQALRKPFKNPTLVEIMSNALSLHALEQQDDFLLRHLGTSSDEIKTLLAAVGATDLDQFIGSLLPEDIGLPNKLALPAPCREHVALAELREISKKNTLLKSLIGQGYYGTLTPWVLSRHLLENPGWYTAYTPYQAEISQGRLEALMNFQQMVVDLSAMEVANASLLDEATAAAEAMSMARRISRSKSNRFLVDKHVFPQTIDVLKTRAIGFGFELVVGESEKLCTESFFGALLQYPDDRGEIRDFSSTIATLKKYNTVVAMASDLLALTLIKAPGHFGADIALGSCQRFGLPLGFGGPHAAYFACREEHIRAMPGRIIGVSKDTRGKRAYRMMLQTREQHIRREKANSNICTSQVLLANMAGMYAVYHGAEGLRTIARRIHRLTGILAQGLKKAGVSLLTTHYFDTLHISLETRSKSVYLEAQKAGYNLREVAPGVLGISLDEKTTRHDVAVLFKIITHISLSIDRIDAVANRTTPLASFWRTDRILFHPVFQKYHGEQAMTRYLKSLQNKDLALDQSMIPLGSCTMKLNATSLISTLAWSEFADVHPFVPREQAKGTLAMIDALNGALCTITDMAAVSMQPNSGAQGEYAGLVVIRRYFESIDQSERTVCLIPKSAHGTNPASAQMAGFLIVSVECHTDGNINFADLEDKAEKYADQLACLMLTYPSTHGVFEADVRRICAAIHKHGGQVYMDGANLNALVGLSSPGFLGADVTHLNLHKTFALPHGGGGPGVGPIAVKAHLVPFLPDHSVAATGGTRRKNAGQSAVSAAPYGSAMLLPLAWLYIRMLGGEGLTKVTKVAILKANYLARKLSDDFPVLYTGKGGYVAHECIFDIRPIKAACGISEIDIAKRLMDYGFHAPTVSFPVPGTLMVEPTESEPQAELDRFVAAMKAIRAEIRRVENGAFPPDNNPLKNAPHTAVDVVDRTWNRPYSQEDAVFPLSSLKENKFWTSVNRIDEVQGDRDLCVVRSKECD